MKKLILAGLLSVGVACANEVKKDTAYKMKLNKEFKLPLSSQALEILDFMHKQKLDNFVFSCALSDKVRMQKKHK